MISKKTKQKIMKHRICSVARIIACVSFLVLTIIGVSSVVRAMSLETIANENGIPSSWQIASLGNPETITIPITYWDQRQDDCSDPDRQFEWSLCTLYAKGIIRGIVRDQLGADGLPVPTYNNSTDAWNAYHDVFTANVTGNNPVQTTDNFYRWFHEAYDENGKQLSKQYNREVVFHRTGKNSYEYGSKGTFPLDDVSFSKDDSATKTGHNFHFTAHMRIPMKISTDGSEQFWFSGDDDVWVFLNGQLVLDLGGLHMDTQGNFKIDQNGNVISTVDNVADQSCRQTISSPNEIGKDKYNNQLDQSCPRSPVTTTIKTNFKPGDVVNLDFFYAERSTSESNTRINITNMNWPISADSDLAATVVGRIGDTDSNLVQFISSISNRDPESPLNIERIAAYINETTTTDQSSGFLPLSSQTLFYTTNPDDNDSWQPVEISAPDNSMNGFKLVTPLQLSKAGTAGDTLYFRYFGDSSSLNGSMSGVISYYTSINGISGVTYDNSQVAYDTPKEYTVSIKYLYEDNSEAAPTHTETLPVGSNYEVTSPEVENYTPDITKVTGTIIDSDVEYIVYYKRIPEVPPVPEDKPKHTVTIKYIYEDGTPAAESYTEELEEGSEYSVVSPKIEEYDPDQEKVAGTIATEDIEHVVIYSKKPIVPVEPETPTPPVIPPSDIIDDDLIYLGPLGEVAYIPNTGIISDAVAAVFEVGFAEIILSQGFVMAMLLIFAGSFATYFSLRKFMNLDMAAATRSTSMKRGRSYAKTSKKTMPKAARTTKSAKNMKSTRTQKSAKTSSRTKK